MQKLQALEVELERKHGCRVLIIQVPSIANIFNTIVSLSISTFLNINTINNTMVIN